MWWGEYLLFELLWCDVLYFDLCDGTPSLITSRPILTKKIAFLNLYTNVPDFFFALRKEKKNKLPEGLVWNPHTHTHTLLFS